MKLTSIYNAISSNTNKFVKSEEPSEKIDITILYAILRSVPEKGIFDIADVAGNALIAPSRVIEAIKELIKRGEIVYSDKDKQMISTDATFKLTEKGIQLKKGIIKADQNRSRRFRI